MTIHSLLPFDIAAKPEIRLASRARAPALSLFLAPASLPGGGPGSLFRTKLKGGRLVFEDVAMDQGDEDARCISSCWQG